jgi:hypothetical protein
MTTEIKNFPSFVFKLRKKFLKEPLAKVYFTPHPCPLPQGEMVYYQAPPLMGGVGEGEHLILLQEPLWIPVFTGMTYIRAIPRVSFLPRIWVRDKLQQEYR